MDFVITPPPAPFVPVRGTDAVFPVRRIYCIGFNYADHNKEMGRQQTAKPVFFSKPADAVVWADIRRGDSIPEIPYPQATEDWHYEVELVVALAHGGRDVTADDAQRLIYGYAVGIDLTRRDLQMDAKEHGTPWDMAKGFDHSAPIGDIVRAADTTLAEQAVIALELNGETRQSGRLADMIVKVPDIIAALSRFVELKPGDLIFTGTPQGVGPLSRGDTVRAFIDGVGAVAFAVAA